MQGREDLAIRSKIIGVLLRNARIKAGKSLRDCAEALGCSSRLVSQYEHGEKDISLPEMEVLASLFGVPITQLWDENALVEEKEAELPQPEIITIRHKMVGVLLRKARLDAGHSQKECAALLGCSSGRISQYEHGKRGIPWPELEVLADFLGVPITYFVDEQLVPPDDEEQQDLDRFAELPPEVRDFVLKPINILYLRVAMQLADLSAERIRNIAETLLDITY